MKERVHLYGFLVLMLIFNSCTSDQEFLIIYSGSVAGFLEDCGCQNSPAGGIARRAEYLKSRFGDFNSQKYIHLDAGGFSDFYSEPGKIKSQALVQFYDEIGLDAVNISDRELSNDADSFIKLVADKKTAYISANIVDGKKENPYFSPFVLIEKHGKTFVVIGVTKEINKVWELSDGTVLKITDPVNALTKLIPELKKKADFVILLAYVPRVQIKKLLTEVKEINIVLGADGYSVTPEAEKVGDTILSYVGRQGQFIGSMSFNIGENGLENLNNELIHLTVDKRENQIIKKRVDSVIIKAREMEAAIASEHEELMKLMSDTYTGYASCYLCHSDIVKSWRKTRHYIASASVNYGNGDHDDTCNTCHTTGYGVGGFVDERITPRLSNVQCESCHGFGRDRVSDPDNVPMPKKPDMKMCLTCHTEDRSPDFDYDGYLEKIRH